MDVVPKFPAFVVINFAVINPAEDGNRNFITNETAIDYLLVMAVRKKPLAVNFKLQMHFVWVSDDFYK